MIKRSNFRIGRKNPFSFCISVVITLAITSACTPVETNQTQQSATNIASAKPSENEHIGSEITVSGGSIRGLISNEANQDLKQFHGIPYAAPPLGDLRWAPPAPVTPWNDVLDATIPGPICMQPEILGVGFYITPRTNFSEDCLTVNVWTRAEYKNEKLPVMFWVHGGGLAGGSGKEQTGELLTSKGAVLVTFNYRLGRLGFFSHPELSAENPKGVSGNQGFRDQIAALKWVRENIAQFGGDPDNITIFGESAGGASVSALQASPMARGLFHRVISQSGAAFHPLSDRLQDKPYAPAGESIGTMFAQALVVEKDGEKGDASLAALRALPAEHISAVTHANPAFSTYEFLPTVDGEVLPDEIANIFARGEQADVPVMIGSNENEGAAVMEHFTAFLGEGAEGFNRFKQGMLGEVFSDIDALYPIDNNQGVMQSWQDLFTDITFTYPTRRWARDMAKVNSDTYLYLFNWHPPVKGHEIYKSFHGADLAYVFGQLTMWGAEPTEADAKFSDFIAETWVRFAKTGNPNGTNLNEWQKFTPENEAYYILGPTPGPAKNLNLKKMTLIEQAWAKRRASVSPQ